MHASRVEFEISHNEKNLNMVSTTGMFPKGCEFKTFHNEEILHMISTIGMSRMSANGTWYDK